LYKKLLTILFIVSFFLYVSPKSTSAATVIFEDDFSESSTFENWKISNYLAEELGSNSGVGELDVRQLDGYLNIYGTGTIDTLIVNGRTVGHIGKAASH
jgi:hypothetical protein